MQGWIKLHRQILNWDFYDDIPARLLFLHLLLIANHEPKPWKHIIVGRGQVATSYRKLSQQCGLSVKQTRGTLKRLERAHVVALQGHSQFTLIQILSYDEYQQGAQERAPKGIHEGVSKGQQTRNKEERNKEVRIESTAPARAKFKKPTLNQITEYMLDRGLEDNASEAEKFIDHYEANGWKVAKNPMKDWKAAVRNWIRRTNDFKRAPNANKKQDTIRRARNSAPEPMPGQSFGQL